MVRCHGKDMSPIPPPSRGFTLPSRRPCFRWHSGGGYPLDSRVFFHGNYCFQYIPIYSPYIPHICTINFHNIFPWMGPSHLVFFFSSQGILLRVKVVQLRGKSSWSLWTRWRPGTLCKGPRLFWLEVEPPCFRGFQESPGGSRSLLKFNRKCPWSLLPKPNRKPDEFPTIPENQGRALLVSGRVLVT